MTESERIARLIMFPMTKAELAACEFLEQRGQQFCVHFGRDNAIEKAATIYTKELETRS